MCWDVHIYAAFKVKSFAGVSDILCSTQVISSSMQ